MSGNDGHEDDRGLTEQLARREAAIGTEVCADCHGPCKIDAGLCSACRSSRRPRVQEVANPYKKTWNTVEDEEGYILAAIKNNTLFVPTASILAERHRATANYLKVKAASSEAAALRSTYGIGQSEAAAILKEAEIQDRLADRMEAFSEHINELKRSRDFTFTVRENVQ